MFLPFSAVVGVTTGVTVTSTSILAAMDSPEAKDAFPEFNTIDPSLKMLISEIIAEGLHQENLIVENGDLNKIQNYILGALGVFWVALAAWIKKKLDKISDSPPTPSAPRGPVSV